MKKITAILLALLLIMSLAMPAFAVTPPLQVPDMPEIPEIEVEIDIPDQVFDDWFEENPLPDIDIEVEIPEVTEPTEPTEPPDQDEVCIWHGWYQWCMDFLARLWP